MVRLQKRAQHDGQHYNGNDGSGCDTAAATTTLDNTTALSRCTGPTKYDIPTSVEYPDTHIKANGIRTGLR